MASIEEVKQRKERAINELDETKRTLEAFKEDAAQGKLLGKLRLWLADVKEGTAVQRAEWKETVVDLAAEKKRLEEKEEYWARR
ncbi:10719_t:CDS:2 [Funneliformis mosseae]|uniref:10719_t:CDS:1 n=1 Tax=Funneliformis mosseae TaxID=27381 RepID=A0A9N9GRP0_FUNMO|nr:10719_t:CDS:2 [Funneliformis mosseae]